MLTLLLVVGAPDYFYMQATTANLRERGEANAPIVAKVRIGAQCAMLEKSGEWAKVNCQGGEGFTRLDMLDKAPPDGDAFLKIAKDTTQTLDKRLSSLQRAMALNTYGADVLLVPLFFQHELEAMRQSRGTGRFKAESVTLSGPAAEATLNQLAQKALFVRSQLDAATGDFVVVSVPQPSKLMVQAGTVKDASATIHMSYQSSPDAMLLLQLWPQAQRYAIVDPRSYPLKLEGSGQFVENACGGFELKDRQASLAARPELAKIVERNLCAETGNKAWGASVDDESADTLKVSYYRDEACISSFTLRQKKRGWQLLKRGDACD